MDPNTLPFYLSASGLSFFLGLLLLWFRRFLPGSSATPGSTWALCVIGTAFLVAGFAADLPRWATVVGSNLLILAGCVLLHTSLVALLRQPTSSFDRFGWGVLAATTLPFVYWGLIEPNGHYRSTVFSLAVVAINSRTAVALLQATRREAASLPVGFLGALSGLASLWMLARGIWLLATPAPDAQRGANPTTWITILAYMVLISLVTAAIAWMESAHLKRRQFVGNAPAADDLTLHRKLVVLWGIVVVFIAGTTIGVYGHYRSLRAEEYERATQVASIANDAFIEHTRQVIGQADNLLRAVRGYYQATRSIDATERFIATIGIDKNLYENIYMIDAQGWPVIAPGVAHKRHNTSDREYFVFHRATADDRLYIGATDRGRLTGEYYFRLSRRIAMPDGSFGGHIAITIRPNALSDFYRQLHEGTDDLASLIGADDRRIRARHPLPDNAAYGLSIDSPLWQALATAPAGGYRNTSTIDGIARQFVYKRIAGLPLVMITGFSDADVATRVTQRFRLAALAALSAGGFVVMLAMILALSLRRQETQEKLAAELKEANEQHMALFNATHEAVILLDGDRPFDCNPATLTMFRAASKEEFLARPPWLPRVTAPIQPDGTDARTFAERHVALAFRNGTDRFDFLHKRLDSGEECTAEVMLTAVHIAGRPVLQAMIRDISERIRYERELQARNEELARRNEEQDRFLSMLSHELKTPLSVIRMSLADDSAESRSRAIRNVADIDAVVERCLQTDRIEHGRIEANPSRCNPAALLGRIAADHAESARLRLAIDALPECATDVQLLGIILGNLIDNALKYGAAGTLVDIAADTEARRGGAGIRVAVSNVPGPAGMPDPERVFRKYYRAPGAHSKTGSGLGLHIAASLARKLGGELSYRSGAVEVKFELWIPV